MAISTFEKLPDNKKEMIVSTGIKEFSRKSYKDVSTDRITEKCGISKGILFHYFGSKKGFYFYCLEKAMEKLMKTTEIPSEGDFYEIIFASMNQKMQICRQFKDEMHMVNMASRDATAEIAEQKAELIRRYATVGQLESAKTLSRAVDTLQLKNGNEKQMMVEGLHMYTNAVLSKYLLKYQQNPDAFFENGETINEEIKSYFDMILFGICE